MNDRFFLWLAQVFYGVAAVATLWRIRRSTRINNNQWLMQGVLLCGFLSHTAFLVMRGQMLQRCPLTNGFETTVFIAWSAVLFYFFVGHAYRGSLLGAFTAPLVMIICLVALTLLGDSQAIGTSNRSPWIDFHAAIAILSYGAFALAFVGATMYLLQEHQLKTRRLGSSFRLLPSIEQLDQINFRLITFGFVMLTVGMIGGVVSYQIVGHWPTLKIVWATVVWLLYAFVMIGRGTWRLRGRQGAFASMMSFAFVLLTFWGMNLIKP